MTARRHHFIAQCYLKGFAVPRKKGIYQLRVFDRKTRKMFETTTEKIGLERDFNRVEVEGYPPDAFETGLARFENELAPALQRTIEHGIFQSGDDRNLVMNLIGAIALRNPRFRELVRKFHADASKGVMDMALATEKRWEGQVQRAAEKGIDLSGSYEDLKKFHEEGQYTVEVDRGYQLQLEMKILDTLLPLLGRRGWVFMKPPAGSGGFITSDHPCCLMWSKPKPPSFVGPGFGLRDTEVFFPLSTKLALVGAFEVQDRELAASEEMVAHFNAAVADYATRQVYARDLHFHYRFPGHQLRKASKLIDDQKFSQHDDPENDASIDDQLSTD